MGRLAPFQYRCPNCTLAQKSLRAPIYSLHFTLLVLGKLAQAPAHITEHEERSQDQSKANWRETTQAMARHRRSAHIT